MTGWHFLVFFGSRDGEDARSFLLPEASAASRKEGKRRLRGEREVSGKRERPGVNRRGGGGDDVGRGERVARGWRGKARQEANEGRRVRLVMRKVCKKSRSRLCFARVFAADFSSRCGESNRNAKTRRRMRRRLVNGNDRRGERKSCRSRVFTPANVSSSLEVPSLHRILSRFRPSKGRRTLLLFLATRPRVTGLTVLFLRDVILRLAPCN